MARKARAAEVVVPNLLLAGEVAREVVVEWGSGTLGGDRGGDMIGEREESSMGGPRFSSPSSFTDREYAELTLVLFTALGITVLGRPIRLKLDKRADGPAANRAFSRFRFRALCLMYACFDGGARSSEADAPTKRIVLLLSGSPSFKSSFGTLPAIGPKA